MNKYHMSEEEKNPTGMAHKCEELKKLIQENPDLPLVVLADEEANTGDYSTMFCYSVWAELGEFLDCQQTVNDERGYTDRDDFEEAVSDMLANSGDYDGLSDDEFDAEVKRVMAEYEPYWRKCILVTVGN